MGRAAARAAQPDPSAAGGNGWDFDAVDAAEPSGGGVDRTRLSPT